MASAAVGAVCAVQWSSGCTVRVVLCGSAGVSTLKWGKAEFILTEP